MGDSETVYNLLPGLASGRWIVSRDGHMVTVTEDMLLPKSTNPIPAVGWECPGTSGETFLQTDPIPVKPDTDYTISWVCDRDTDAGKAYNFEVYLLASKSGDWIRYKMFAIGGGRKHFSATLHTGSDWESAYVRFDNNRVTEGTTSYQWVGEIMMVEGSTPAAWAPAEGETLTADGGGGGMTEPTNLVKTQPDETTTYTVKATVDGGHKDFLNSYLGDKNIKLSATTSFHIGITIKPDKDIPSGHVWSWILYKDDAGAGNFANSSYISHAIPAGVWTRLEWTVTVPAGMILWMSAISIDSLSDETKFQATNFVVYPLTGGRIVRARGTTALVSVSDGAKGDKGDAGATGTSVTSTVDEWYLSTSSTILSGGSWSSTRQAWASGKYYWRRIKTTYSDGRTSYTPSNSGYYDAVITDSVAKANDAYSIADGKNAIYYSDTAPAGNDYAVNDVWFDTKNDNVMYYWDGSRWVQKQFGTTAVKDGAILADKLAVNSVTADKLAVGSVTANKLAVNSVTADKLAVNSVTADKLAVNSVTADKLAVNSVTADKLAVNSVTADKLAVNSVTADKLAVNSVTADKLAVNSVTADKLAVNSVTANKIDINDLFAQNIKATGTIEGLTLKGISIEGSYAHFGSAIFFRLPKNQNVWANALWTNIEEDSPTANKIMLGMDFDQVAIAAWASLQSGLTVAGTAEFKLASTFQNTVNLNGNLVTNSTINGNKYQYVTTESKTGLNLSIAANRYQSISGYLPTKSGYTLTTYSVRCTGTNGVYVVHPGMGSPYILNTYSSAVTVTALNFTCVWTKT